MCFSAEASFAAAAGLTAAGAVALRLAPDRRHRPYAAVPFLFAIQQALEGMLWLVLPDGSPSVRTWLTHAYSAFSHVFWPVYVPIAAWLIEPPGMRRRLIAATALAGALAGTYLLYFLVQLPIVAVVSDGHIDYVSPHFYVLATMALYLTGTCVSMMLSSHRWVAAFGVGAAAAAMLAYAAWRIWFISVWCFLAATLSAMVLGQMLAARGAASGRPPSLAMQSARPPRWLDR
jgi:hypothetical protein